MHFPDEFPVWIAAFQIQSKQETQLEKSINEGWTNGIGEYRPGKQRIVEAQQGRKKKGHLGEKKS